MAVVQESSNCKDRGLAAFAMSEQSLCILVALQHCACKCLCRPLLYELVTIVLSANFTRVSAIFE